MEALLAADFEIGHFFRERFIPKVNCCCGSKLMHHSKLTRSRQINLYLSRKAKIKNTKTEFIKIYLKQNRNTKTMCIYMH